MRVFFCKTYLILLVSFVCTKLLVAQQTNEEPKLATDNSGNAVVVWLQGDSSRTRVMTSLTSNLGTSWTPPVHIGGSIGIPPHQALNRSVHDANLAYTGNNTWLTVWIERLTSGTDQVDVIGSSQSVDSITWSMPTLHHPTASSSNSRPLSSITVSSDRSGTIIITWLSNEYPMMMRSHDNGISWTAPYQTCDFPVGESKLAYAQGRWYHGYSPFSTTASTHSLEIAVSADNGATWDAQQIYTQRGRHFRHLVGELVVENENVFLLQHIYVPQIGANPLISRLAVRKSTDYGATWTQPLDLGPIGNNSDYSMARDKDGIFVAVVNDAVTIEIPSMIRVYRAPASDGPWTSSSLPLSEGEDELYPTTTSPTPGTFLTMFQTGVRTGDGFNRTWSLEAWRSTNGGISWEQLPPVIPGQTSKVARWSDY